MKTFLKLAVLLATLLLLAGVAFADDCYCYKVNYTGLDAPDSGTFFGELCFDDIDNIGTSYNFCRTVGDLIMFFDHHPDQALLSSEGLVGYLKFHEWIALFNGIEICGSDRYYIHGQITDPDNCAGG